MGPERRRGRPASLGHFAKPFSASVQTNVLSQRLTRLLTRLQQFLRRGEIPVETGAPDLGRKSANRVQGSLKTVSVLGSEPDFRRALTFVHNHSRSEPVLLISGIESGILSRESSFRSATNFYAQRMRAVIQRDLVITPRFALFQGGLPMPSNSRRRRGGESRNFGPCRSIPLS